MARKPIPEETQKSILTKSRRRCCLCFWLDGMDEVQKGQIAHLDQNNENWAEETLAFLCLNHHDEYDGKTSVTKGLRETEVRHWRDELYKEMEYRFRTVRKRTCELTVVRFLWLGPDDEYSLRFRLRNNGEIAVRSPTVSVRLPDTIRGTIPKRRRMETLDRYDLPTLSMPDIDPWAVTEQRLDLFEPQGRVMVKEFGGVNPVLMPGHVIEFDALMLRLRHHDRGRPIELEYRVDIEDAMPSTGIVTAEVPKSFEEFLTSDDDG